MVVTKDIAFTKKGYTNNHVIGSKCCTSLPDLACEIAKLCKEGLII